MKSGPDSEKGVVRPSSLSANLFEGFGSCCTPCKEPENNIDGCQESNATTDDDKDNNSWVSPCTLLSLQLDTSNLKC